MHTFITFKWKPPKNYKTYFNSNHVNILYESIRRNIDIPFQFVCITDDCAGIKPGIITAPIWPAPVLSFEMDERKPNCYRRLEVFSENGEALLGSCIEQPCNRRILIDLDVVITGNITQLCTRYPESDFVRWYKGFVPVQGAFVMWKPGTCTDIWEYFRQDPVSARRLASAAEWHGSDQGILSLCRGDAPAVTKADGIYSYARDGVRKLKEPPADCCIVVFHGTWSPWYPQIYREHEWIRRHWRE